MIESLVKAMEEQKLEVTWREIADAVWLAAVLGPPDNRQDQGSSTTGTEGPRSAGLEGGESGTTSQKNVTPTPSRMSEEPRGDGSANIHAPVSTNAGGVSGGAGAGTPIRVPRASALKNALAIGRALRPLARREPSPFAQVFDEAATVRRAADCDIWIPVLRPAPARPFEMALVIDGAITMAAWHETLREFRLVLERLGAFFDVRAWRLHAAPGPEGSLTLAPEGGNPRVRRKADELRDATGRRLVLVASDCVSEPWHDGRARDLLESWGRTQPVALLPMLPPSLWRYTGLGWATPILVRAPRPGAPNAALVAKPRAVRPARRLVPGGRPAAGGPTGQAKSPARVPVPVPVLPLQPEALVAWAQTLTSPFAAGVTALILRPAAPAVSRPEGDHSGPSHPPGEARVERFARMSSPTAQELAGCFAAAPLRMSILRIVQRALLPDSDNLHLAEILLGGLFYPIPAKSDDPDDLAFEFYQGVREVLLDRQDISRSLEVFTTVTRWVSERFGQALDFQAILDDPEASLRCRSPRRTSRSPRYLQCC